MKNERLEAIKDMVGAVARTGQKWHEEMNARTAMCSAAGEVIPELVTEVERLKAEVENLRAVLTDMNDRVAIWEIEKVVVLTFGIQTERLRWQFLGHLARKALGREAAQ